MLQTGDALGSLILEAKTSAPEFNDAFVRRSELIDGLAAGEPRLITVTAPAGYGKTSFLAEWRQSEERATGWLAFRPEDDDPAMIVRLIAFACAGFASGAEALLGQVPITDGGVLGRMAPALALALSRSERSFVLFLDDAHVIEGVGTIDALNVVLAAVPKGSQVVLASRSQPTRFARGRLAASAAQVGAEELRIDLAGAARIAAEAGARVDDETLGAWVERCDGWAAGLHMCALLSKTRPFESVGEHDLLADYLYQECVRDLPEDVRGFLLRSSILREHIPDLCDAVLERTDSARVLRDLEARQLFVTADRGRRLYRLHPLFREYLQDELHLEAASSAPALHLRAAQWFQERGQLPAAIEHAIAAQAFDLASALVTAAAVDAYASGRTATLGRWLDEIGDANLIANPSAAAIIALFSVLSGTDEDADKWRILLDRVPADAAGGWPFASVKAMIQAIMMTDGLARALVDAEYVAAAEGVDSPWQVPALQVLGSTLLHAGHEERAMALLAEAKHFADAHGNAATIVICETEPALLAVERGDWAVAEEQVGRALETIRRGGIEGYVMCAYAYAAAACVELRGGRRAEGERRLAMAMSERQRCGRAVPLLGIPTRLLLVRAHLQLGDCDAARLLLAEIDEMLPPQGQREAMDRRIAAARSELQRTERRVGQLTRSVALTAAEQRVLPYLQTHLTRPEIAQRLFVSPNTVGSQVSTIFRKLGVSTRADAVRRALELGLLGPLPDLDQ